MRFVTSCSRPPLLGFEYLYPKFGIRWGGGDTTRLPSACELSLAAVLLLSANSPSFLRESPEAVSFTDVLPSLADC